MCVVVGRDSEPYIERREANGVSIPQRSAPVSKTRRSNVRKPMGHGTNARIEITSRFPLVSPHRDASLQIVMMF